MAKYSWLPAYEAALRVEDKGIRDRMLESVRKIPGFQEGYDAAVKEGIIKDPTSKVETRTGANESGSFETSVERIIDPGIDYSKLPKMGPAGMQSFSPESRLSWIPINNPYFSTDLKQSKGTYNDPNYGTLQLDYNPRSVDPLFVKLAKAAAIGLAAGPIAGSLGGAMGLASGSFGQGALSFGIKAGLGSAFSGSAPSPLGAALSFANPFGNIANLIKGG